MSVARKVLFPIQHIDLWTAYKQALDCMWKVEEVDLSKDYDDFTQKLTDNERNFIEKILAFFAAADSIVNINIIEHMQRTVPELEAQYFYNQQVLIECIHTEMYNLLIHALIKDEEKQATLLNGFESMPCVRRKAEWAMKYIENENVTLAERLIAFAIVEGVFFSGSFAAIFYMKTKGVMPGLTFSNELISRDEGLHTNFACLYYNTRVDQKLDVPTVSDMFAEAVAIEMEFFAEALPESLVGMNAEMMRKYIEFVADRLLVQLKYPKIYHTENPFEFMNNISLEGKTNFFEKRVGEYKRFGAGEDKFQLLNDF
ncbi:RR2 [Spodoptera eridania nucleopolyhedrovirus]|uniref:ribonucleoside-diphosphate reductase n=1 Tax=Spodoptera eridania nucleopolyhedrovirus TaxID=2315721 RepID=A0A346TPY4_9ABAC|nr:RR2b [Spodoptera litura nucleopolyhedrovirus II]YP_010087046.1 RR2 [Spodoptera eridania nucleopolyhedrovirus]ACI47415.1 RR2b [Spodoptera litura nucleopolyhedrovirus II]AXU41644.1 RR2 [Spodoptera eridania nucleopolyhedrovirus]